MKVTVFSTTTCAFCKVEKQWLDSKGIKYEAINIDEEESAKEYVENITGRSAVPVTVITDGEPGSQKVDVIKGFNRPALTEALGL